MTYTEMICEIIKLRGQHGLDPNSYFEMHHIVPSAWGGEGDYYDKVNGRTVFYRNSKHKNCLWVTPEEHFELHRLLWKENRNDRAMVVTFMLLSDRGKLTAEEYGELRGDFADKMAIGVACIETKDIFNSLSNAARNFERDVKPKESAICVAAQNMNLTEAGFHWAYIDFDKYAESVEYTDRREEEQRHGLTDYKIKTLKKIHDACDRFFVEHGVEPSENQMAALVGLSVSTIRRLLSVEREVFYTENVDNIADIYVQDSDPVVDEVVTSEEYEVLGLISHELLHELSFDEILVVHYRFYFNLSERDVASITNFTRYRVRCMEETIKHKIKRVFAAHGIYSFPDAFNR